MTQAAAAPRLSRVPTWASRLLVLPPQAPERTSDTGGCGRVLLDLLEDKPGLLPASRAHQRAQTLPWGVHLRQSTPGAVFRLKAAAPTRAGPGNGAGLSSDRQGRAGLPGPGWTEFIFLRPHSLTTLARASGEGTGLLPIISRMTRLSFLADSWGQDGQAGQARPILGKMDQTHVAGAGAHYGVSLCNPFSQIFCGLTVSPRFPE